MDNEVLIPFSDDVHLRVGDFAEVRISAALPNSLRGEWLGVALEAGA